MTKVNFEIDLEPIKKELNKYLVKKLKEQIRERSVEIVDFVDFPELTFRGKDDAIDRLIKLEDWKKDIEDGWIKPGDKK